LTSGFKEMQFAFVFVLQKMRRPKWDRNYINIMKECLEGFSEVNAGADVVAQRLPRCLELPRELNKTKRKTFVTGLPDDIFSNKKSYFGYISEGLAVEDVEIFYGRLAYFVEIWHISWLFGIFFPFW
jgi:hypothetical protein